jgi:hypothetical protein
MTGTGYTCKVLFHCFTDSVEVDIKIVFYKGP